MGKDAQISKLYACSTEFAGFRARRDWGEFGIEGYWDSIWKDEEDGAGEAFGESSSDQEIGGGRAAPSRGGRRGALR